MPIILRETKHYQTAKALRRLVNRITPGELVPVAADLAERLDASHGTVVRALAALAREGLIHRPLGRQRYVVSEKSERFAARIMLLRPDYPSEIINAMIEQFYGLAKERHWGLTHHSFRLMDALDFPRLLHDLDAAVLWPCSELMSPEFIEAVAVSRAPIVTVTEHVDHPGVHNVVTDDFRVGALAAETLWAKGHRRVWVLRDQPYESTMRERLAGFAARAAELGLEHRPDDVLHSEVRSYESARNAAYRLLRQRLAERNGDDATALFALSLDGGMAALRAARECGRSVPDDLAVLAFGGEADSVGLYLNPPLSVIAVDAERFIGLVVEALEHAMRPDGPRESYRVAVQPFLVERESL